MQCQYCHGTVEQSSYAGIPPTKTCMNCHAQIWTNADLLEPVRESWAGGKLWCGSRCMISLISSTSTMRFM